MKEVSKLEFDEVISKLNQPTIWGGHDGVVFISIFIQGKGTRWIGKITHLYDSNLKQIVTTYYIIQS